MTEPDELVTIHEARHEAEAEMIRRALESEGIPASVEQTASPLDGLTAINEGTEVQVYGRDRDRASAIVNSFLAEHDEGQ
jgi:hypothetical protein